MIKEVLGILGLISIIIGTLNIPKPKEIRRKYTYPFLVLGGLLLFLYSILIRDIIFIILQGIYILISIYGWKKISKNKGSQKL